MWEHRLTIKASGDHRPWLIVRCHIPYITHSQSSVTTVPSTMAHNHMSYICQSYSVEVVVDVELRVQQLRAVVGQIQLVLG